MFGLGKATCVFCDHRVPRKEVFRVRDSKDVAICVVCYEAWERAMQRTPHGRPIELRAEDFRR